MTFEEFVAVRLAALIRQATVLAGDPYLAEDVVQDVLIKAQPRWKRIGTLEAPEAYLRKMIVNELLSLRRQMTARWRRERAHPPAEAGGDGADNVVQRDAMVRLIKGLPPRQRIVIALRYFEDMADADIADVLGCSPVTVRTQASRALATLRAAATPAPTETTRG